MLSIAANTQRHNGTNTPNGTAPDWSNAQESILALAWSKPELTLLFKPAFGFPDCAIAWRCIHETQSRKEALARLEQISASYDADNQAAIDALSLITRLSGHLPPNTQGREEEAAREYLAEIGEATQSPTKQPFKLFTLRELEARPAPEYLIDRILSKGGTGLLTAKHASFKTFVSLDMALCVATGTAWHGRAVKQGAVVYVAAEGAGGLLKRARAWCIESGCKFPDNFHIIDRPAQLGDRRALAAFIESVSAVRPALIVLDTLARCAVGLDENSAKDMGAFVESVGHLAETTGAHVLTVHHNNKTGEYRGSSALVAAVDTHLSIERDGRGDILTLKFEKQKDAEELPPMVFTKHIVDWIDQSGNPANSLVFRRDHESQSRFSQLSAAEEKVLRELCEGFGETGATSSQWEKVCEGTGIVKRTFMRAVQRLKNSGYIHCPEQGKRGAIFKPDAEKCADFLLVTLVTNGDIAPNDTNHNLKVTFGDIPFRGVTNVTNGTNESKSTSETATAKPIPSRVSL